MTQCSKYRRAHIRVQFCHLIIYTLSSYIAPLKLLKIITHTALFLLLCATVVQAVRSRT